MESTSIAAGAEASPSTAADATAAPSTSASAPEQSADAELSHLSADMFAKLADYVRGHFDATLDEYGLLAAMNDAAAQRYADVRQVTAQVADRVQQLNAKYENMKPYLDQIDEIDNSSKRLEEAAYALDAYVRKLEARFNELEKRGAT